MSGPYDPSRGESQTRPGAPRGDWPQRDLGRWQDQETDPRPGGEGQPSPPTSEGPVGTRWDPSWGDRRRPTTAEQAVPWLIGLVLLLTGIVIVLVVLIFTMEAGGVAEISGSPSPNATSVPTPGRERGPAPNPASSPSSAPAASPSGSPVASAKPNSAFGELEMVYLSRSTGFGASGAYRHDFATDGEPTRVAATGQGITWLIWASDGSAGAVIAGDLRRLTTVPEGATGATLADGIDAATFGPSVERIYAARITSSGDTDTAQVLSIAFADGATESIDTIGYPTPRTYKESNLKEAQFADDGGYNRLYMLDEETLVLWVLAGGAWQIDIAAGSSERIGNGLQDVVSLESPDGRTIRATENVTSTTLAVVEPDGSDGPRTTVVGLVSHLRWSADGTRVVFTLAQSSGSGGTLQDIFVWEVDGGESPARLTSNGASYGAEWLGAPQSWTR